MFVYKGTAKKNNNRILRTKLKWIKGLFEWIICHNNEVWCMFVCMRICNGVCLSIFLIQLFQAPLNQKKKCEEKNSNDQIRNGEKNVFFSLCFVPEMAKYEIERTCFGAWRRRRKILQIRIPNESQFFCRFFLKSDFNSHCINNNEGNFHISVVHLKFHFFSSFFLSFFSSFCVCGKIQLNSI